MSHLGQYAQLAADGLESLIPACDVVDSLVQEEREETDDEGAQ